MMEFEPTASVLVALTSADDLSTTLRFQAFYLKILYLPKF